MTLKQTFKDWTLPIAMAAGAGGYFLFHGIGPLAPLKPAVWTAVQILTPSLIFIQLFLTFCKIEVLVFLLLLPLVCLPISLHLLLLYILCFLGFL